MSDPDPNTETVRWLSEGWERRGLTPGVRREGEALYRAALRCLPRPEPSVGLRALIDRERIRDPHHAGKTLDGRDAREVWGANWRDSRDWQSRNKTGGST